MPLKSISQFSFKEVLNAQEYLEQNADVNKCYDIY